MKLKFNWGHALILFFALFFAWVLFFVLFALRQNNDLVSDDYYQKGAKYSDQMSVDKRSVPYQDSIQVQTEGNQVKIVICQTMASAGDSLQVLFFRSSDKEKDVQFSFSKTERSLFLDKGRLSHGRYQVFLQWSHGGEQYMVKKILDIE